MENKLKWSKNYIFELSIKDLDNIMYDNNGMQILNGATHSILFMLKLQIHFIFDHLEKIYKKKEILEFINKKAKSNFLDYSDIPIKYIKHKKYLPKYSKSNKKTSGRVSKNKSKRTSKRRFIKYSDM